MFEKFILDFDLFQYTQLSAEKLAVTSPNTSALQPILSMNKIASTGLVIHSNVIHKPANTVKLHTARQKEPAFDSIRPAIHLQPTQMNALINTDLQQQPTQASAIVDDSSIMYQLVDGSVVSMDQMIVSTAADDENTANANIAPTTSNDDVSILSLLSNIANSVSKIATNQGKYDRRMD